MTTVTWDSATAAAQVTFSNANLTLSSTATDNGWYTARASASYSTGKFYLETAITTNLASGLGTWSFGVANASQSQVNYLGSSSGTGLAYYPNNGGILPSGTIQSGSVGQTVCVAYDFANKNVWFRIGSGNWNNSSTADPATNTGGVSFSAITGPYYPAFGLDAVSGSQGSTTTKFGATAFSFSLPSGFSGFSTAAASRGATAIVEGRSLSLQALGIIAEVRAGRGE